MDREWKMGILRNPAWYPWGQVGEVAREYGFPPEVVAAFQGISRAGYSSIYPNHILDAGGFVTHIGVASGPRCNQCGHRL